MLHLTRKPLIHYINDNDKLQPIPYHCMNNEQPAAIEKLPYRPTQEEQQQMKRDYEIIITNQNKPAKLLPSNHPKKYTVLETEFPIKEHPEYNTLQIRDQLGYYERIVSLLKKCNSNSNSGMDLVVYQPTHGGYIPIECSNSFKEITCILPETQTNQKEQEQHLRENIKEHNAQNVKIKTQPEFNSNNRSVVLILPDLQEPFTTQKLMQLYNPCIIIVLNNPEKKNYTPLKYPHCFLLTQTQTTLHLQEQILPYFQNIFYYYLPQPPQTNEQNPAVIFTKLLSYDNLIHLCMIVKNGGEQFRQMLQDNYDLIDRWTILDTGSTDNTIETIHNILDGKKEGQLYEEPFVNFRDSRNRCLELAGQECKFTLMLDDTYVVQGDLRKFLTEIRGDTVADSFSLFVHTNDSIYTSNRILKTSKTHLRYKYKIHEVVEEINNMNVIIPTNQANIIDRRFDYMEKRTMERKTRDLELLFEEVAEDPTNPRNYYYIATTYLCMQQYDKACEYFLKRGNYESGFIQERIDALFEAARMLNFHLLPPAEPTLTPPEEHWEKCEELYNRAFQLDPTRPETRYFIGIHYYQQQDYAKAYEYFKHGFELGFPEHCQHSLKPTLCFHFLPQHLTRVCFMQSDFQLGMKAAQLFLQNKSNLTTIPAVEINEMQNWLKIYTHCEITTKISQQINQDITSPKTILQCNTEKSLPLLVFLVDGGWGEWNGRDLHEKGVGGSETWAIEMARNIQKSGEFQTKVFCRTPQPEIVDDVEYCPIQEFFTFANNPNNKIHTTIVSRYTEYLPAVYMTRTENVYLINHDLFENGTIIIRNLKLKRIFCLTEWHQQLFQNMFPTLQDLCTVLYYGIDATIFDDNHNKPIHTKQPAVIQETVVETKKTQSKNSRNKSIHIPSVIYEENNEDNDNDNENNDNNNDNNNIIIYEIHENNPTTTTKQPAVIPEINVETTKNMVEKIPHRFIYSSFPDRGLLPLLQMWRHIIEIQPAASLSIYSDVDGKWVNDKAPQQMQEIKELLKEYLEQPHKFNLQYFGWVKKAVLYEAWKTADIWLYPCLFQETFCLTALEAAASRTFVITNHLAALENTVGNRGMRISGDAATEEWKTQTLDELKKILDPSHPKYSLYQHTKQSYIADNYAWATSYSWKRQAEKLCDIILQETNNHTTTNQEQQTTTQQLEYKEMYGWTCNIPTERDTQLFLQYIERFNQQNKNKQNKNKQIEILEIGSYTGVSAIEMLKRIPQSQITCIDMWENYTENNKIVDIKGLQIEQSFYKNMEMENQITHNRFSGIKGRSCEILMNMMEEKRRFDFIYVDGSHQLLDCYADLLMAWRLLSHNGMLVLDDYLFDKKTVLNSPYEGIEYFIETYKRECTVLDKSGWRVFLQKK